MIATMIATLQVEGELKEVQAALAAERSSTEALQSSLAEQQAAIESLHKEKAAVQGELKGAQAALAAEQSATETLQNSLAEQEAGMQGLYKEKAAVQDTLVSKETICQELQQVGPKSPLMHDTDAVPSARLHAELCLPLSPTVW